MKNVEVKNVEVKMTAIQNKSNKPSVHFLFVQNMKDVKVKEKYLNFSEIVMYFKIYCSHNRDHQHYFFPEQIYKHRKDCCFCTILMKKVEKK